MLLFVNGRDLYPPGEENPAAKFVGIGGIALGEQLITQKFPENLKTFAKTQLFLKIPLQSVHFCVILYKDFYTQFSAEKGSFSSTGLHGLRRGTAAARQKADAGNTAKILTAKEEGKKLESCF